MKQLFTLQSAIVILCCIHLLFFTCRRDGVWVPNSHIEAPDTTYNTHIVEIWDTVFKTHEEYTPVPDSTDGPISHYADSLVTEDLTLYIGDKVYGSILARNIGYRLNVPRIIETTHTIEITKTIPYPVKADPVRSLYVIGGAGEMFSAELLYQDKGSRLYGIQTIRQGSHSFYMAKFGIKIK
jgi:hypothetical protein